jgi:hypothetical protein
LQQTFVFLFRLDYRIVHGVIVANRPFQHKLPPQLTHRFRGSENTVRIALVVAMAMLAWSPRKQPA